MLNYFCWGVLAFRMCRLRFLRVLEFVFRKSLQYLNFSSSSAQIFYCAPLRLMWDRELLCTVMRVLLWKESWQGAWSFIGFLKLASFVFDTVDREVFAWVSKVF